MRQRTCRPCKPHSLQVIVLNSKRKVTNIPPPAITVFANRHRIGWKSPMPGFFPADILRHHCENSTVPLTECVEENTFDLSETIHSAHLWHTKYKTTPLTGSKIWTTHFTSVEFGRGYTMRFAWNSSADYDQVYLLLNNSLEYTIFIHDPNYFLVSKNPLAMPTLYVTINPIQSFSHFEQLLVTEHQLLENCEPELGYSFQTCVQQVALDQLR